MRITNHSGRVNAKGEAYSAKHNDRNNIGSAEHIDPARSKLNRYWRTVKDAKTNEECERIIYDHLFRDGIRARNDRYIAQGHKERVKTVDDYLTAPRTCPDEIIYQIGRKDDSIDQELLWDIVVDQINWEVDTFPNIMVMDIALHCDEKGAPHCHIRKTYFGHDDEGNLIPNQTKALEEMGLQRPFPEKGRGKFNNEKQTYTRLCREHFAEVCREYGLDIDLVPKESSEVGLTLTQYKVKQEEEKLKAIKKELEEIQGSGSSFDRVMELRSELT